MKIGIVNYSVGNVGSVFSAFGFYKYDVRLINKAKNLEDVDFIVLAGVGNFRIAMSKLKELRFIEKLNDEVIKKKKPILGICLGMQLFADVSFEDGKTSGFGWIKGEVQKLQSKIARIPHMGWNRIVPLDGEIFNGMRYNTFYFMHSYSFHPEGKNVVIANTQYRDLDIVAAVRKDNIVGVQFHPEKSQGDGLRLLRNIIEVVK